MRSIIAVLAIAVGLVFSVGNAKVLPTNHYNVVMTCHGNSATCDESFDVVLPSSGNVEVTFTVSNGHCAPLKIDFMINGETINLLNLALVELMTEVIP